MNVDIKDAHKVLPGVIESVSLAAWTNVVGGPVNEQLRIQLPFNGEIVLSYYVGSDIYEDYLRLLDVMNEAVKSVSVERTADGRYEWVAMETSAGLLTFCVDGVRVNRGDR